MPLPNTALIYIRTNDYVLGTADPASPDGAVNRELAKLLANDQYLAGRFGSFTEAQLATITPSDYGFADGDLIVTTQGSRFTYSPSAVSGDIAAVDGGYYVSDGTKLLVAATTRATLPSSANEGDIGYILGDASKTDRLGIFVEYTGGAWVDRPNCLDEDDMVSNDPDNPPSQQSTKAFVEGKILDDDNFTADSSTQAASQRSTKALKTSLETAINKREGLSLAEAIGVNTTQGVETSDKSWRDLATDAATTSYITASGATNSYIPNAIITMFKSSAIGGLEQLSTNYWTNFFAGWLLGSSLNATGTTIYDLDQTTTPKELSKVGTITQTRTGMKAATSSSYVEDDGGSHLWSGADTWSRLVLITPDAGNGDISTAEGQTIEGQYESTTDGRIYTYLTSSGQFAGFHGHTGGNALLKSNGPEQGQFMQIGLWVQDATHVRLYINGSSTPVAEVARTQQTLASQPYRLFTTASTDRQFRGEIHAVFTFKGAAISGADYAKIYNNLRIIYKDLLPAKQIPPVGNWRNQVRVSDSSTSNLFYGSQAVGRLPNGKLYYKEDEFDTRSGGNPGGVAHDDGTDWDRMRVHTSTDNTDTWTFQNNIDGLYWAKEIYQKDNEIYFLGTTRRYGSLIIAKSTDNLATITTTTLQSGSYWHTAPTRSLIRNGKLIVTYERNTNQDDYPIETCYFAHCDLSDDLMVAGNWTHVATPIDSDDYDPAFANDPDDWGLSEAHAVLLANGRAGIVARFDAANTLHERNYICMREIADDLSGWHSELQFIKLNGGYSKIDPVPLPYGGYGVIHQRDTDTSSTNDDRSTLQLSYTSDFKNFITCCDILKTNEGLVGTHGIQYPFAYQDGEIVRLAVRGAITTVTGSSYHNSPNSLIVNYTNFAELLRYGKLLEVG